jgi:hypothetical protein
MDMDNTRAAERGGGGQIAPGPHLDRVPTWEQEPKIEQVL